MIEVSMAVITTEGAMLTGSTDSHYNPLFGGYPESLAGRWPIRACDPAVVDGYSLLAKAVHSYGAKCFIQVSAGGSNFSSGSGVSAFPWPSVTPVTTLLPFTSREMDKTGIDATVEAFGVAAKYIQKSGLDGIDIHGSHGGLISEFLSPIMNKRKDGYGGSTDNRVRLLLEIIKRVREETHSGIAVGMRLMGDEKVKGGIMPEYAAEVSSRVDGQLDWITPDLGVAPQQDYWAAVPMYFQSGYNLRITNPIKAAVKKTKIGVVGRYVDPYYAEHLISEDLADMVAMTRALIADPELPNKAMNGTVEEIRPCIGVLQDCWGRSIHGLPMSCTVNPAVSREKEWGIGTLKIAERKKKVLIIGAGPAGLETARIAAERGHKVVIYEKSRNIGGQALIAAKLPGRADIKAIVNWEELQLKKLGVEIKFGLEVTTDSKVLDYIINEEKPDVVVIATGSTSIRTGFQPYDFNDIEGWNEDSVCTDIDALEEGKLIGNKIIIADSLSFIEAPGIAELLARQGKDVEIVTMHPNVGLELKNTNHLEHVLPRIFEAGVKIAPYTWIRKISGKTVTLFNVYNESDVRVESEIDNVILITGKMQNDSLYFALKPKIKEVYLIGDANIGGARIGNAFYDGQTVGRAM